MKTISIALMQIRWDNSVYQPAWSVSPCRAHLFRKTLVGLDLVFSKQLKDAIVHDRHMLPWWKCLKNH